MIVGICLGILLGLLSGIAAVLLLYTAWGPKNRNVESVIKIVAELLAIATFWFSGPAITSAFIRTVPVERMINSYMCALTIVFALVVIVPMLRIGTGRPPWAPS